MSAESRELVALREGEYARAASAAEKFHVELWPELRAALEEPAGAVFICRACGQRKRIRPMMHVCLECFYELEAER